MSVGKDSILKLVRPKAEGTVLPGALLADIHKALRAIGFYPQTHPLRNQILSAVCESLQKFVKEKELVLAISRTAISFPDDREKVEQNSMVAALAGELFVRRVQQLTFLPDLTLEDLQSFLQLLTLDPRKLSASGGLAQVMVTQGIKTIWANEIDLSVIWEKRRLMEAGGPEQDLFEEPGVSSSPDSEEADSIEKIAARLEQETDDSRYQQLARLLCSEAERLKAGAVCAPIFPVLEMLVAHCGADDRTAVQRDYALFTLEKISGGVMTDFLLQQLETRSALPMERVFPILKKMGEKVAYGIIQRLCLAEGLFARKALAAALLAIGHPAIPPIVAMLKDDRWYVVRNMVALLGQIANQESTSALAPALHHKDQRVRKETVHALVKLGGSEAEGMILSVLDDEDPAIVLHAVMALGLLKSRAGVPHLIHLVTKGDFLGRQLNIKREAIQSLGRIGDKRATQPLLEVLEAYGWLPWKKWDELKIAAATALGRIEDETALPVLKAHAARGGRLGKACVEAIDNMERIADRLYE